MENSFRHGKDTQSRSSLKQRRSGYEPSDTETEWQESPWRDVNEDNRRKRGDLPVVRPKTPPNRARNISPLSGRQRYPSNYGFSVSSKNSNTHPEPRKAPSRSPYKPQADEDTGIPRISPVRRNTWRHVLPYKSTKEEDDEEINGTNFSNRKYDSGTPLKFIDSEKNGASSPYFPEASKVSERSSYSRKAVSAPRLRPNDQQIASASTPRIGPRSRSPSVRSSAHKQNEISRPKTPSGEINEMIANAKLQATGRFPPNDLMTQSTDSITPCDIFFSRDYTARQKKFDCKEFAPEPTVAPGRNYAAPPHTSGFRTSSENKAGAFSMSSTVSSTTNTNTNLSTSISRQSSGETSQQSGKMSYASGKMSGSFRKFTASRQKKQTDAWFSCARVPWRTSKSPEHRQMDETSFIEKAFVVENLSQFWADKHRPGSLNGFICHKQQAQQLKQLISHTNCPHILFKGPAGSGKRALCMALLREIYGSSAWKEARLIEVVFPLTSSPHHMELNLRTEIRNAKYALMALVKEIASNYESTPEVSDASYKKDYKVIVLYEVDNLPEHIQHLIKWIMDCYTDACKIILCCEDDTNLLESVKGRCKLINVDAPVAHEILEVLVQIARKENFELPMTFAARIATKSKQNLRKAIMALEACKVHNYPFADEQTIPLGWEEVVTELATEILADPTPKRLVFARAKLQKLLVDFVHPKLILQRLVEQFLKGVNAGLKRQLYYWHAYYDRRLPPGTSALLKLEEFLAKFASIHRRSSGGSRRFS
ncbi:uncharacterized protein [Aristolochia californica]|uniref:uncharacterized protein n=1 Tax=Aristolochia californica TaxID=171875 RepID=UPI0035DE30AD